MPYIHFTDEQKRQANLVFHPLSFQAENFEFTCPTTPPRRGGVVGVLIG